jgi:hypothetical protein
LLQKKEQELRQKSKLKDLQEKRLTDKLKMLLNQLWKELKDLPKREKTDWKPKLKLKEQRTKKPLEELKSPLKWLPKELRKKSI